MTEKSVRRRNSLTTQQRTDVRERTHQIAQDILAEERRRREAKTERLRAARLRPNNNLGSFDIRRSLAMAVIVRILLNMFANTPLRGAI